MSEKEWRDLILRAPSDPEIMADLCKLLIDCEEAKHLLRKKGYGVTGTGILETAREVPLA